MNIMEIIGEAFGLIFAGLFILLLIPGVIAEKFVYGTAKKQNLELKWPF